MNKSICILLFFSIIIFSCNDDDTILPTTGNVIFLDYLSEYKDADYSVVTEVFFLSQSNPFRPKANHALQQGKITEKQTTINNLNAGVYYLVIEKTNSSIASVVFQVRAGETEEYNLSLR